MQQTHFKCVGDVGRRTRDQTVTSRVVSVQDVLSRGGLRFDSTALPPGREGGWSVLTYDISRRAATLAADDSEGSSSGRVGGGGGPALWSASGGPAGPVRLALAIPYCCTAIVAGDGGGPPSDRRARLQVRQTDGQTGSQD